MRYYVYIHVDPHTGETVYAGYGSRDRAWKFPPYCKNHPTANRAPDHIEWMEGLVADGFWPGDWVCLIDKNLNKEDARYLESKLIDTYAPRFNKINNQRSGPKTRSEVELMRQLRSEGQSWNKLAQRFNCSRQTVQRYVDGISKPKEEYVNHK